MNLLDEQRIAQGGTISTLELITSAIEAERKATAARCVEIAEKYGLFALADAIRDEFELEV
ncbi:hypothetical protein KAR91_09320 [Candidatus Pacearchaeota archaeon]|nr:hypothetical protein [Candidatus Pacearchaeota archaeon]